MGVFTWHNGEPPKKMKVTQVYGIVFDKFGRTLMRIERDGDKKNYSLAGGTPEAYDADRIATLRREMIEEVNTTLKKDIYVVGYMEVNEPSGIPPYAQLRMTALLDKIGKAQPDPDGGETYERLLTSPEKAIKLLNWGKEGEQMIKAAVKIAKEKFNLQPASKPDEYV